MVIEGMFHQCGFPEQLNLLFIDAKVSEDKCVLPQYYTNLTQRKNPETLST